MLQNDDTVDLTAHLKWVEKCHQDEIQQIIAPASVLSLSPAPMSPENTPSVVLSGPDTARPAAKVSLEPNDNDILFGRGKGFSERAGNLRFRNIM